MFDSLLNAIDMPNTLLIVQLDDALSATRLPDGKIKVWIHVADPTCLVAPCSIIDRFSSVLFLSVLKFGVVFLN